MCINLIRTTIYLGFRAQYEPFLLSGRPANRTEEPNLDELPTAVCLEPEYFLTHKQKKRPS